MERIKFFVGPKTPALLAEKLRSHLQGAGNRAGLELQVVSDRVPPGVDLLEWLIGQCRGMDTDPESCPSDFYAVILTQEMAQARDWLFEIGIFTAGLDFQFERCFVVVSQEFLHLQVPGKDQLPSYISGRRPIEFKEPEDISDPNECAEAMRLPAEEIRDQIWRLRKCPRDLLKTIDLSTLFSYERPWRERGGALADDAEVLINRDQPAEEEPRWAAWIMANMRRGIQYRYFFHDQPTFGVVARMIYALATVVPDLSNPWKWTKAIATRPAIVDNLTVMREQLSINLIPSSGPIEFCVHNITDPGLAACYLKYPVTGKHVKWCEKQPAVKIAKELTDLIIDRDPKPKFIFRSTSWFHFDDARNEPTKRSIWQAVNLGFNDPELMPLLREICFEHLSREDAEAWAAEESHV